MPKPKVVKRADILAVADRKELVSRMEPMLLSDGWKRRSQLNDLAIELAAKSAGFKRSLPESMVSTLGDLVRSMNCYYSNLIEGHNTHPIDIERALRDDFSEDKAKRNLQQEAKAHIEVQKWIDVGGVAGRALSTEAICEMHKRFYDLLPDELCWVENPETKKMARVVPGLLRRVDVRVGQHIGISPGAVPRFMDHFEHSYLKLGRADRILAAAAAHHRLAWIHPFPDGNGRVMRLMSHAMILEALDTGALWSVARGLAKQSKEYKDHLANCDLLRRSSLDGRGNLSEEALAEFTEFFLRVCLDQVGFMESLMRPDRLRARILGWAKEQIEKGELSRKSDLILEALLYRGELERADLAEIVGTGERQARRVVSDLAKYDVIRSESSRAPIRLSFPATLASAWMPGLFPELPASSA
jgi:Fic family protein